MNTVISILFLFASLGVVNGLMVGIYLWLKKNRTPKDFFLGGLLLALSARIGKSVYYYFMAGTTDKLILQIGLSACLFIGPFFYFYMRSVNQKTEKRFSSILLAILLLIIVSVGFIYPYRTHPEIWNGYIIHGIYAVWVFFTIVGLYFGIKHIRSNYDMKNVEKILGDQLFIISLAITFITLTYLSALYISGFTYIWGSIAFTLFFYYMMANVLLKQSIKKDVVKPSEPIANASQLLEQLDQLMEAEELYLNPKLKLNDVATAAKMNRNLLSQLLNDEYKHGFSTYINEFRVNKTMELIQSRPELSLEGIGFEAGFNSKSSFFAAFKKISSCTPSQFKKQLKQVQTTPK